LLFILNGMDVVWSGSSLLRCERSRFKVSLAFVHLLLLIIVANGAPVLIRFFLQERLDAPVDFGAMLPDGRRLFGGSKTWRGVIGAVPATAAVAALLGYSALIGMQVAIFAILGDLISSFSKRRLGMKTSCMAPLLDQVPESLLPALVLMADFGLDDMQVIALVAVFVVAELLLSLLLYRLGVRNRPY
jgi:CDP-2,3-bis-(O-geranylgeranyl)-sn-glycerol synthase